MGWKRTWERVLTLMDGRGRAYNKQTPTVFKKKERTEPPSSAGAGQKEGHRKSVQKGELWKRSNFRKERHFS